MQHQHRGASLGPRRHSAGAAGGDLVVVGGKGKSGNPGGGNPGFAVLSSYILPTDDYCNPSPANRRRTIPQDTSGRLALPGQGSARARMTRDDGETGANDRQNIDLDRVADRRWATIMVEACSAAGCLCAYSARTGGAGIAHLPALVNCMTGNDGYLARVQLHIAGEAACARTQNPACQWFRRAPAQ